MKTKRTQRGGDALYKAFIYVALITFVITILVPVSWAFLASVKEDSEFYGNPWALPQGFHFQNFCSSTSTISWCRFSSCWWTATKGWPR